jgi:hypothetical protein
LRVLPVKGEISMNSTWVEPAFHCNTSFFASFKIAQLQNALARDYGSSSQTDIPRLRVGL